MQEPEALRKPDMPAVIERTHISGDLRGFLLPIFEALSNCLHSIEQKFGDAKQKSGRIEIVFSSPTNPENLLISVQDNGLGLDQGNFDSFLTPFSGLKLQKKGRGFGRFIAFKVFERINYQSRSEAGANSVLRTFRFDIYNKKEIVHFDGMPDFAGCGVKVEFDDPKLEWHEVIKSLDAGIISDELAEHFFPEFLQGQLPQIDLLFGEERVDLNSKFQSLFVPSSTGEISVEIEKTAETLTYTVSKIPHSRRFNKNVLMFAAAGRIVGAPRDLGQKLGKSYFLDEDDKKYIIAAVVSGEAFEKRLNDSRTNISITPKVIEKITSAIAKVIEGEEAEQIRLIKEGQKAELSAALTENPILRMGLKGETLEEYINRMPNSWGAEEFVGDLALKRFRASEKLSESIAAASNSAESYYEEIKGLVQSLDIQKKDALAEYVVHRKKVISLIEAARRYDEKGDISPEDTVHDLIFRRFSDSTETGYFDHNLWIVDDLLAFCPYISSDRTVHGGRRSKGDKVTDLLFYEDSMVLGENDGSSLAIVEFKKPGRDDYRFGPAKSDPVMQVVETIENALAAGSTKKKNGEVFSFSSVTRRFAYIVADLTPTMQAVLRKHDFQNEWNPNVWYRYRENEQLAIYAYGYDTMLENAKKRNAAFFKVLLDE